MKQVFTKALNLLRNKFILATAIFFVYTMLLDENDIFTIISQSSKRNALKAEVAVLKKDLITTRLILSKLEDRSEVEKYAREKKLFKKDDEDVFVIFYE